MPVDSLPAMPYEVVYEPGVSEYLEGRLWGEVTQEEVNSALAAMAAAIEAGATKELTDLSGVSNVGELFKISLAARRLRDRSLPPRIPRAVVVSETSGFYTLLRALSAVFAPFGIILTPFGTRDEAVGWLRAQGEQGPAASAD
jgi:hypothetical protein